MSNPPQRSTSLPFAWDGRVLQVQYSPSGQFEDIDDPDYDVRIVDTLDCTGAFRLIDITLAASDTSGLPRASAHEPQTAFRESRLNA